MPKDIFEAAAQWIEETGLPNYIAKVSFYAGAAWGASTVKLSRADFSAIVAAAKAAVKKDEA